VVPVKTWTKYFHNFRVEKVNVNVYYFIQSSEPIVKSAEVLILQTVQCSINSIAVNVEKI